jgi:tetratricopeptide (TPR) repeat protein
MIVWMLAMLWGCSADHYADKGKRALDGHDMVSAEGHYRAALARDTQHVGALSGLGWVYLLAGQKDAAMSAFKLCIQVSPESVECMRGRAGVASAVGKPAEAREWLEKALLIAPFDGGVQSSLALLDLAAGNVAAALQRYGQLVARFPDASEYRLGLAEAHLRNKDYTEALSVIDAGLDAHDGPVRTRAMLLQTQARTLISASGKRVDAARCAETAPVVLQWLDAAEQAVELAKSTGVELPDLPIVRRRLKRQQVRVVNLCPK